jgi:hypothetical protein
MLDLNSLIAINRAARAVKVDEASCDDGDFNHHHYQSRIAGRDRRSAAPEP